MKGRIFEIFNLASVFWSESCCTKKGKKVKYYRRYNSPGQCQSFLLCDLVHLWTVVELG